MYDSADELVLSGPLLRCATSSSLARRYILCTTLSRGALARRYLLRSSGTRLAHACCVWLLRWRASLPRPGGGEASVALFCAATLCGGAVDEVRRARALCERLLQWRAYSPRPIGTRLPWLLPLSARRHSPWRFHCDTRLARALCERLLRWRAMIVVGARGAGRFDRRRSWRRPLWLLPALRLWQQRHRSATARVGARLCDDRRRRSRRRLL